MNQSQPTIELTDATSTSTSRTEAIDPLPWLIRNLQRKRREQSQPEAEHEAVKTEPN